MFYGILCTLTFSSIIVQIPCEQNELIVILGLFYFYRWYLLIRQYKTICWGGNFKSDSLCSYCNILPSSNSAIITDWVASLVRNKKKTGKTRIHTWDNHIQLHIKMKLYRPWNCPMFQDCQIVSLNVSFLIIGSPCTKSWKLNWIDKF